MEKPKFEEVVDLASLEALLDRYHANRRFFNVTDRSELSHFVLRYNPSEDENVQFVRVCKKLIFFSAFPVKHDDLKWSSF